MLRGLVEYISRDCSFGWLSLQGDDVAQVYAVLDGRIVGTALADIRRDDLMKMSPPARAFVITFQAPLSADQVDAVEMHVVGYGDPLRPGQKVRRDKAASRQVFVLGSPRSGTSEMGSTLSSRLGLPWLGEYHAAPAFAAAADALQGDPHSEHRFERFIAKQGYRNIAISTAQKSYYYMHSSSSFLDKTPGVPMIEAAPFLAECFPEAKFIYLRRNGISNVLSRMTKFGGQFDNHCADWAAAMDQWDAIKAKLPSYIEIEQEEMLDAPERVGEKVAAYLGVPELSEPIGLSLRGGRAERTGAGIGRTTLASTGWSPEQIQQFRLICGPTMTRHGYEVA